VVEVFSILIFSDLWACWMRAIDLYRKNLKYFERLGHCPVYFYIIFVRFFISLLFVKGVVSKEAALFLVGSANLRIGSLRARRIVPCPEQCQTGVWGSGLFIPRFHH